MQTIPQKDQALGHPEHYSWIWKLLLTVFVRPWLQLWYKRITVTGRENIPHGKPIIFAPNHQNGIIDPLLVLSTSRRQIVWLANADSFRNKVLARVLRFLRVMPLHRLKDGSDVLGQNRLVFTKCVEILKRNHELGLFPEGVHWGLQRLRPSQKTISRIAFMAEELHNFELDVQIVPVGITYSHYHHFHHNVLVQFGKPISVKQFQKSHIENPDKADIELRQTIDSSLLELMIHIPSEQYYSEIRQLLFTCDSWFMREMGRTRKHLIRKFVAHKQLTDVLLKHITLAPIEAQKLFIRTAEYGKLLSNLKMHDSVLDKSHSIVRIVVVNILLCLLLPVFIVGFLTNVLPFTAPYKKLVAMNKKDPQLIGSFTITSAFFMFPLWYGILCFVFSAIWGFQWENLLLFVIFGITGVGAFHWRRSYLRNAQRMRLWSLRKHDRTSYNTLFALRNELIISTMQIFEQHKGAWGKNKKKNM